MEPEIIYTWPEAMQKFLKEYWQDFAPMKSRGYRQFFLPTLPFFKKSKDFEIFQCLSKPNAPS